MTDDAPYDREPVIGRVGLWRGSGLRMMPTFPWPSLEFRTAGFPQYYGFKAGMSDRACPCDAACTSLDLPLSLVLPAAPI